MASEPFAPDNTTVVPQVLRAKRIRLIDKAEKSSLSPSAIMPI